MRRPIRAPRHPAVSPTQPAPDQRTSVTFPTEACSIRGASNSGAATIAGIPLRGRTPFLGHRSPERRKGKRTPVSPAPKNPVPYQSVFGAPEVGRTVTRRTSKALRGRSSSPGRLNQLYAMRNESNHLSSVAWMLDKHQTIFDDGKKSEASTM